MQLCFLVTILIDYHVHALLSSTLFHKLEVMDDVMMWSQAGSFFWPLYKRHPAPLVLHGPPFRSTRPLPSGMWPESQRFGLEVDLRCPDALHQFHGSAKTQHLDLDLSLGLECFMHISFLCHLLSPTARWHCFIQTVANKQITLHTFSAQTSIQLHHRLCLKIL